MAQGVRIQRYIYEMTGLCHRYGCCNLGTKSCGACGEERYCSAACQKEDWKIHKILCVDVKKLPTSFLTLPETQKWVEKSNQQNDFLRSVGKIRDAMKVREKFLAFLNHQLGVHIKGTSFCKRSNGDIVDYTPIILSRLELMRLQLASNEGSIEAHIKNVIEIRQILENFDKSKDSTLIHLTLIETDLATLYAMSKQYSESEHHCAQSLMFAKLIKGEERVSSEYKAMKMFVSVLTLADRKDEYLAMGEEAYILVSEAYGPQHPDVQDAAAMLITHLMETGNFARAEDFSRINYESLTDPLGGVDQQSAAVANGMRQLAAVWVVKDPVDDEDAAFALAEEAEQLIRKACKIMEFEDDFHVYLRSLGDVLMTRKKYTEETRTILERSLVLGRPLVRTHLSYVLYPLDELSCFHNCLAETMPAGDARDKELRKSEKYLQEASAIREEAELNGVDWSDN